MDIPEYLAADFEPPDTAVGVEPYVTLLVMALVRNVKNLSNTEACALAGLLRARLPDRACCQIHEATFDLMQLIATFVEMLTVSKRVRTFKTFVLDSESAPPPEDSELN